LINLKLPFKKAYLIGIASVALISLIGITSASAVEDPVYLENQSELERIDLPVSWRQTRARFRPSGASTETESFKETWSYLTGSNGLKWLESSRAKVQVFHAITEEGRPNTVKAILIDKQNLIRLLGLIKQADLDSLAPEVEARKVLRLDLSTNSPGIKTIVNLSEEEHYVVHLRVSEKL